MKLVRANSSQQGNDRRRNHIRTYLSNMQTRWRIRVGCLYAFMKSPEFGRTAYSGKFGVRSLFQKKKISDLKKKLLKSNSIFDIIIQRRFYSYN